MKHKSYIDARVAHELGMDSVRRSKVVRAITTEFVRQLCILLAEQGAVGVDGLGRFTVSHVGKGREVHLVSGTGKPGGRRGTRVVSLDRGLRVYFRKSAVLKELLKEKSHERPG